MMIALAAAFVLLLAAPAHADLVGAELRGVDVAGVCGDGVLGNGETCDSGTRDTPWCDSGDCTATACGDGYLNDRESCPTGECYTAGTDLYDSSGTGCGGSSCCSYCTGGSVSCTNRGDGQTCTAVSPDTVNCSAPNACNGSGTCKIYTTTDCPGSGAYAADDDSFANIGFPDTNSTGCSVSGYYVSGGTCTSIIKRAFGDADCIYTQQTGCSLNGGATNWSSQAQRSGTSEFSQNSAGCSLSAGAAITSIDCYVATTEVSGCDESGKVDVLSATVNYYVY